MSSKAIIITGTPGTGKTTLSKLLASRLSYDHIEVAELVERERLYTYIDKARGSRVVSLKRLRIKLLEVVRRSARPIILSTTIPDVLPKDEVSLVIVLRTNPLKLMDRLRAKAWPEEKIRENVASEAIGACLQQALSFYGDHKVWELDTTYLRPEEVLKEAVKIIRGEATKKLRIDWLAVAARDDELASLLAKL